MTNLPAPGAVPAALRPILREMIFVQSLTLDFAGSTSAELKAEDFNRAMSSIRALRDCIGPDTAADSTARAHEILALPTGREQLAALSNEPPEVYEAVVKEIRKPSLKTCAGIPIDEDEIACCLFQAYYCRAPNPRSEATARHAGWITLARVVNNWLAIARAEGPRP